MLIPKTMQAVVYRGRDDLRVETLPVPKIRSGELLVKVAVCGVCPTDIKKIHYGTVPSPRVFGHETSGTIVQLGAGVKGFRVGDRVGLHHHIPCMKCHYCEHRAFAQCAGYKRTGITAGFEPAGGGYAEYVRVMPFVLGGVVRIPARNSFLEGAMLEPVNTVLKGVRRLSLLRGDSVMVVGQGPIGLMFTRLLKLRGMKVLATDMMDSRLKLARRWGASKVFRADDLNLFDKIKSAAPRLDAAVVAVPVDAAVQQALELVRGSGQVLLFAHTRPGDAAAIDLSSICMQEKDLVGSYSADYTLQKEAARLVFSRQIDMRQIISHEFPLEQTAAAIALASKPTPDSLKIVVKQG